jgi:hypothetical protein
LLNFSVALLLANSPKYTARQSGTGVDERAARKKKRRAATHADPKS